MNLNLSIVSIGFIAGLIPLALIFEGLRRKIVARMQNRIGPPIWQPIYDILKLWHKGKSDSLAYKNIFYRLAPFLYFIFTFALFLFIPLNIISFKYDFIFLIYLLVLDSALYVLAGFASNSPYSTIASMRELVLMVCYEMVLAVVLATVFVFNEIISFAQLETSFLILKLPLAAVCFFYLSAVEIRITPYDTVEAPTEVLEGVKTEFSGKNLMFMELAKALKLTFFAMLFVYLLIGYHNLPAFIAVSTAVVFAFAFTQATTCRYRIDQALKRFIIILGIALIEFVRIKFITW